MPYKDGTGPSGKGSGRNHGHRHWYRATGIPGRLRDRRFCYSPHGTLDGELPRDDADLNHLKGVARNLEETLRWIESRISNMEDDTGKKNN